jgi:hypothetical protein
MCGRLTSEYQRFLRGFIMEFTLKFLAFVLYVWILLIAFCLGGCSSRHQKPIADMTIQELQQVQIDR